MVAGEAFGAPSAPCPPTQRRLRLTIKTAAGAADNSLERVARYEPQHPAVKGLAPMALRLCIHLSCARVQSRPATRRPARASALWLLLATVLACAPPIANATPAGSASDPPAPVAPTNMRDLDAWLDYKGRADIDALPSEARIFYRHGRIAWTQGQDVEAVRLVRGAATLDPSFAAPHVTLFSWFVFRDPSQALLSAATLVDLVRKDFRLQLHLVANSLFFLLHAWFFGVLAAALLLVALHQGALRHLWHERLCNVLPPRSASIWAWVLLLLPWAAGLGLALPALVFLAMLWPTLKRYERGIFLVLAAQVATAPLAGALMGRLALPLQDRGAPYYGITGLEHQPYSTARESDLAATASHHPDDGFLHFGLAWMAKKGGYLETADAAYRRVLEIWPSSDRAYNNLGNILASQGRFDEALKDYGAAVNLNPSNAAAYFNASQVHTRVFDYGAASDALARASALDFEMVKSFQTRSGSSLPLVDEWIAPGTLWGALLTRDAAGSVAIPRAWYEVVEASGWRYTAPVILLTLLALGLGIGWQRELPIRPCSNCSRIVCRRCSKRRREVALCRACAAAAAQAESPDFAKVLLGQRARSARRRDDMLRTALASLVPGFGLLTFRHAFRAVVVLTLSAGLASMALGVRGPFLYEPHVASAATSNAGLWFAVGWVAVYTISILEYLSRASREKAQSPASARGRTAPDHTAAEAA